MTIGISIEKLIQGLPVATVVFDAEGSIIIAADAFWQFCGARNTVKCLAELGSLGAVLQRMALADELLEGQCTYKGSEGSLQIAWRQVQDSNKTTVVACILRESNVWIPSIATAQHESGSPVGKELPNPDTTRTLLDKALISCEKQGVPLSIAHICVTTEDHRRLMDTDYEAWRSVGRKLRATCRMSDLVGTSEGGDFLVILMNLHTTDAEAATHRLMTQLNSWCSGNLTYPTHLDSGLAAWTPGSTITAAELFEQAGKVRQAGKSA